jgi:uncharacterized protein (DUF3084 family)
MEQLISIFNNMDIKENRPTVNDAIQYVLLENTRVKKEKKQVQEQLLAFEKENKQVQEQLLTFKKENIRLLCELRRLQELMVYQRHVLPTWVK